MWYNESTGFYEYFDTICNESKSTVSTTTSHFCSVVIVDKKVWEGVWGQDLYSDQAQTTTTNYRYNTLISIDISKNMEDVDPYRKNIGTYPGSSEPFEVHECNRRDLTTTLLHDLSNYPKQNIGLCTFDYRLHEQQDIPTVYPNSGIPGNWFDSDMVCNTMYTADYASCINEMLSKFNKSGTSVSGSTTTKYINTIYFISDGSCELDNDLYSVLNKAKSKGIKINTIALPGSGNIGVLETIANKTEGKLYTIIDQKTLVTATNKDEVSSYIDFTTNSDSDSIPDIFEKAGMLCTNGQVIYSDYTKSDTDNDGLNDDEEIIMKLSPIVSVPSEVPECVYKNMLYRYVFTMKSDPNMKDTDGDGYQDNIDADPLLQPYEKMNYIIYMKDSKWIDFVNEVIGRQTIIKNKSQKVKTLATNTLDKFVDSWNGMGLDENGKGKYMIDNVYTIYHGSPNSFTVEYKYNEEKKEYSPSKWINNNTICDLHTKNINNYYMSSCNCGNLDWLNIIPGTIINQQNLAIQFLKKFPGIKNIYAWGGYLKYINGEEVSESDPHSIDNKISKNQDFKKWSTFVNGFDRDASQQIHYNRKVDGSIDFNPKFKDLIIKYSINSNSIIEHEEITETIK